MGTVPMTIPVDTHLSSALYMKFEIDARLCVMQHKTRPIAGAVRLVPFAILIRPDLTLLSKSW